MRKCPYQDSLCPIDVCREGCVYMKKECEFCNLLKGVNQSKFINVDLYQRNIGYTTQTHLNPKFCPMCGKEIGK